MYASLPTTLSTPLSLSKSVFCSMGRHTRRVVPPMTKGPRTYAVSVSPLLMAIMPPIWLDPPRMNDAQKPATPTSSYLWAAGGMPKPPKFVSKDLERDYLKFRLAQTLRIFGESRGPFTFLLLTPISISI